MSEIDEMLREINELRNLLEQDLIKIGRVLGGDVYDAYDQLIRRELQQTDEISDIVKRIADNN